MMLLAIVMLKSNQIKSFISAEKKNNIYELIFKNHNM